MHVAKAGESCWNSHTTKGKQNVSKMVKNRHIFNEMSKENTEGITKRQVFVCYMPS